MIEKNQGQINIVELNKEIGDNSNLRNYVLEEIKLIVSKISNNKRITFKWKFGELIVWIISKKYSQKNISIEENWERKSIDIEKLKKYIELQIYLEGQREKLKTNRTLKDISWKSNEDISEITEYDEALQDFVDSIEKYTGLNISIEDIKNMKEWDIIKLGFELKIEKNNDNTVIVFPDNTYSINKSSIDTDIKIYIWLLPFQYNNLDKILDKDSYNWLAMILNKFWCPNVDFTNKQINANWYEPKFSEKKQKIINQSIRRYIYNNSFILKNIQITNGHQDQEATLSIDMISWILIIDIQGYERQREIRLDNHKGIKQLINKWKIPKCKWVINE